MIFSMICLNEVQFVYPCITNLLLWDGLVSEIRVIDGGSTDGTLDALASLGPKVKVFHHPYDVEYHDAQIMQRNIALSYIPNGEWHFILDFDERLSPELVSYLKSIKKDNLWTDADLIFIPRRTFESIRLPGSTKAAVDSEGWPVRAQQVGQYPDFQPRLIRKRAGMVWVNSPHHSLIAPDLIERPYANAGDIIHYHGKFDSTDRLEIEKRWAKTQARRAELGLTCDIFDAKLPPELMEYAVPRSGK